MKPANDSTSSPEPPETVLYNGEGSLPPLVMILTWSIEGKHISGLARELGPEQPVYSIAPPHFDDPDDYPLTTEAWCDFMDSRLQRIEDARPLILGGWSFGGVIALELAERMVDRGRAVSRLLMFDTLLPTKHTKFEGPRAPFPTRAHRLARHILEYCALPTRKLRNEYLRHRLSPMRRLRKIRAGIARRWKPAAFAAESDARTRSGNVIETSKGERMSPLMRSIHTAYLKYEHHLSPLPVAQFWTQPSCTRARGDSSLGWSTLLRGDYQSFPVAGQHMTLFDEEYLPGLADEVARLLRRDREAGAVYRAALAPKS